MADRAEDEVIEDLPTETKGKSLRSNPWLPIIAVVVLLPVLSFALVEFVFIPRLQTALAAGPAAAEDAVAVPVVRSGGPGAPPNQAASGGSGNQADASGKAIQLYHFDTIKTNLSNPSNTLIIVKFSVKGSDPEFIRIVDQYRVPLTDATLKVLSLLTRVDIQSPGIQNVVKNDLVARFNQVLGGSLVEDLYFVDFVTQ